MRYSTEKDDPGYPAYRRGIRRGMFVHVLLDGKPVERCITADTKRRKVLCLDEDKEGRFVQNARRDSLKLVQRFGKVELRHVRGKA